MCTKKKKTDDPRVEEGLGDGAFTVTEMKHKNHLGKPAMFMKQSTKRSRLSLACTVTETISGAGNAACETEDNKLVTEYSLNGKKMKPSSFKDISATLPAKGNLKIPMNRFQRSRLFLLQRQALNS
uniref:hypothetical protein n=1 Tax=Clostridium sp. NkU-1 TaxID=1095009 RepID=UPI0006D0C039